MKNPDQDLVARLRKADPMKRLAPDDPGSTTASRIYERVLAPAALGGSPPERARRIRASRALPVLAVAAAIIAVVGLSLPRNTPGPVRSTIGSREASASADRAKLLRVAEHQDAVAADVDPALRAKQQQFLDRLMPYPEGPTSAEVMDWLEDNCAEVNGPIPEGDPSADFDCSLLAATAVISEAPAHVAADVLRALTTLDVGLPTHAERCPDWDSVDPAWRAKVEEAESHFIWIKRNGTLLVATAMVEEDRSLPGAGNDELTPEEEAIREQIEQDLADGGFSSTLSLASSESEVFVQCKPSAELVGHEDQTVDGAMSAYTEEHGDGCGFSETEVQGLVAIDFAQACQTGVPSGEVEFEMPSCPADEDGGAAFTFDDSDGEVTVTCEVPPDVTTTSVGG